MVNEKNDEKPLQIAMYPWFALGHFNAFLSIANKLAERGHKITFFVPTKTQTKLSSHNHHPTFITFIPITVPHVDGLPVGSETTHDIPTSARPLLMTAMDLTKDIIDTHLARLKPNFVFFDFAHWIPGLARKHGSKSVQYSVTYLVGVTYFMSSSDDDEKKAAGDGFTAAQLVVPPPWFPCPDIRLKAQEARVLAHVFKMEFGGGMSIVERNKIGAEECDAVGFKTCRELEGAYFDFYQKKYEKYGKTVLLAGPMIPEPARDSKLDDYFDGWLKGFESASVVYCALGSECMLRKDQFQQLVLGLELTGRPFLAVLQPPTGCETIESALPEGFLERTKGRGIVHGGWVQQQLILKHPSVGCFVTHSGANSMSEALMSECQLVLLPTQIEQFIIARMMSFELKISVEIDKGEEDDFVKKEAVCKAITVVMEEDSQIGRQVRINHNKWRQLLLTQGLEDSYITEFVHGLRNLLG